MKRLLATAGMALGLAFAAAPAMAQLTPFATFSPRNSTSNFAFDNATNSLFTAVGSAAPSSVLVNFSFLDEAFEDVDALRASFTFNATSTQGASTMGAPGAVTVVQAGFSGSFSFIYNGDTPFEVNGITYGGSLANGGTGVPVTLLSATFTGAQISGPLGGTTGSVQDSDEGAADLTGGSIVYDSDVLEFGGTEARDFSLSLSALLPALSVNANGKLNSFRTTAGGTFSTEPPPEVVGNVPETGTWAMLVIGFGAMGAAMRTSRRKVTFTA